MPARASPTQTASENAARIDEWATSVETLLSSIEQAQATAVVLERLKLGAKALKEAQKGYGVEDVHETLREFETGAERQAEMDAALADQLDADAENAALAELAELEKLERETAKETVDPKEDGRWRDKQSRTGDDRPRSAIRSTDVAAALPSARGVGAGSASSRSKRSKRSREKMRMRKRSPPSREPSRGGVVSARRTARRCGVLSCVKRTHAHTRVSAVRCAKDGARDRRRAAKQTPNVSRNV